MGINRLDSFHVGLCSHSWKRYQTETGTAPHVSQRAKQQASGGEEKSRVKQKTPPPPKPLTRNRALAAMLSDDEACDFVDGAVTVKVTDQSDRWALLQYDDMSFDSS